MQGRVQWLAWLPHSNKAVGLDSWTNRTQALDTGTLAQSYLQSSQDDFGYRREVSVPKELSLLTQGQDPVVTHSTSDGRHLEEGRRRNKRVFIFQSD